MNCKKCNAFITEAAKKCNCCGQKTGCYGVEREFPQCDMFGYSVHEFFQNEEKANIRKKYIETLPEYLEKKELTKSFFAMVGKMFLTILGAIAIFFVVAVLGLLLRAVSVSLWIGLLVTTFIIVFGASIVIFVRSMAKNRVNSEKSKAIGIHDNKERYYFNPYVLGYVVLDHTTYDDGDTDYFYAFYEVEKANIQYISYDSYYGEYVLGLKRPVYIEYALPATREFRLPDVFDDIVLSNALGCDLPPKNMPY